MLLSANSIATGELEVGSPKQAAEGKSEWHKSNAKESSNSEVNVTVSHGTR